MVLTRLLGDDNLLSVEEKMCYALCGVAYGYPPLGGCWPEAKGGDFAALRRCVLMVYRMLSDEDYRKKILLLLEV